MKNNYPPFIYGTAWKKEATTQLVEKALSSGFTAIDTANQAVHYAEALVGAALVNMEKQGILRENLYLQTKFTPANSQDSRIPYDPRADYATQVHTSFNSSLEHLHIQYVDAYLLHGPYSRFSLTDADWEVWGAIEELYASGKAKMIGVSNFNKLQLELLVSQAKIKPMIVQNRCFAVQAWDKEVREFCQQQAIIYQGFSLLTANTQVLTHRKLVEIAHQVGKTPAQIIFKFASLIGIVPLIGTTNEQHMREDLQANTIELAPDILEDIYGLLQDSSIL